MRLRSQRLWLSVESLDRPIARLTPVPIRMPLPADRHQIRIVDIYPARPIPLRILQFTSSATLPVQ